MLAWRAKYIEWLHRASNPPRANNVNEGALPIASMTGFARAEGGEGAYEWAWEVKSVNSRGLDVRCRLPAGMEALEPAVREALAERIKRGHVVVHLQISLGQGEAQLRVNPNVLEQVAALAKELEIDAGLAPARADGLLALRGVIEVVEPEETAEERERREAALLASLAVALDELVAARRREGERLEATMSAQIDEIARLVTAAESCTATQADAIRARLAEGIALLLEQAPALSEDRLEHEAAILILKADVREELDRLSAHLAAARELLAGDAPAGRRLDFLTQELNREANTLCAKSSDIELTRLGLDLKAVIDQFREQVQNIE